MINLDLIYNLLQEYDGYWILYDYLLQNNLASPDSPPYLPIHGSSGSYFIFKNFAFSVSGVDNGSRCNYYTLSHMYGLWGSTSNRDPGSRLK